MKHKIIFFFSALVTILFFLPQNSLYYTINFDLNISPSQDNIVYSSLDDIAIILPLIQDNKKTEVCQLFYTDKNAYQLELSHTLKCNSGKDRIQHYSLKIYSKKIYPKIRFDLPEGNYTATLSNLSLGFIFIKENVPFSKNPQKVHHIKIIHNTVSNLSIQSTGADPYIELNDNLHLPYYNMYLFLYFICIFMLIYIFLYLLAKVTTETFIFLLLLTYTFYTVFGQYDIRFHYILPVVTLYFASIHKYLNLPFIKQILLFLTIYIGWASLSMILPVIPLANPHYLYETFPLFIANFILLIGIYKQNLNALFFKKYLSLLLLIYATTMFIIHGHYMIDKDTFLYGYITFYTGPWLQKNYMFWYVLLLFGTLSFYNIKNKKDMPIIVFLLIMSYVALANGYSKSALLAFVASTIVYLIFSYIKFKKRYLLTLIWLMTLYIIFSPILFSFIDLSSYHQRLISRNEIYHTAAALIKEHWLLGYGYGSTMLIDIRNFLSPEVVSNLKEIVFRGGHPHNLSLLFWLEFGIFGAIFLAYYIHKLLLVIVKKTYGTHKLAALFAMFIAIDIISAFSWSIWYPKVLHTFAFFGILLIVSINSKFNDNEQSS